MQIAMVGLGRMGANMVRRLMRGGHHCVVFDRNPASVDRLCVRRGVGRAFSGRSCHGASQAASRVDHGTGGRTNRGDRPGRSPNAWSEATASSTAENSYFKDDVRRGTALARQGISYLDVGTSGGVWGVNRGYCMMIGGDTAAVQRLEPDLSHVGTRVGATSSGRRGGSRAVGRRRRGTSIVGLWGLAIS